LLRDVKIEEALNLEDPYFVDVRSESEFSEASIPGAVNLPVLNDEERARVGTVYRLESPVSARWLALEIITPKLLLLTKQIDEWSRQKKTVVLYCWRGGMRSRSLGVVCDLMGIQVYRLIGGYKAHRRLVREYLWEQPLDREVVVLHGLTGVGKTEVLEMLAKRGLAVIDLEALASNRGSVFGGIGLPSGPNQKMFEATLAHQLWSLSGLPYVMVECESRRIGKNSLPTFFMEAMRGGRHLLLYDTLENRVQRLVREYTNMGTPDVDGLSRAIEALKRRLGGPKIKELIDLLMQQNYAEVTRELLINYYDPLYRYPCEHSSEYDLSVNMGDVVQAADQIEKFLNNYYG
jgi:tRNA 2-selenouridine synthase